MQWGFVFFFCEAFKIELILIFLLEVDHLKQVALYFFHNAGTNDLEHQRIDAIFPRSGRLGVTIKKDRHGLK
jgi:hypothetical protein